MRLLDCDEALELDGEAGRTAPTLQVALLNVEKN